jgi:hypothetical protein
MSSSSAPSTVSSAIPRQRSLRKAFAGNNIEERFKLDFGQGSNGVIVDGSGGSIGFSLDDAPESDYTSGRVKITHLNGVGLPDHAPTNMEDGC